MAEQAEKEQVDEQLPDQEQGTEIAGQAKASPESLAVEPAAGDEQKPEPGTPPGDAVPLAKHLKVKAGLKSQVESAEKTAEELAAELELYKLAAKQQQQKPEEPAFPKYEDFESEQDWQQAVHEYTVNQANTIAEKKASEAIDRFQTDQQRKVSADAFESEVDKSLEAHAKEAAELKIVNYEDKVAAVSKAFGPEAFSHLLRGGLNAATLNYMASNPAILDKFTGMKETNPAGMIFELAQLQAGLGKPASKPAADPDVPLEGAAAGGSSFHERIAAVRRKLDENGRYDFKQVNAIKREARAAGVEIP